SGKNSAALSASPMQAILRGIPAHIRSDNGPAKAVQDWIAVVGAKPPTSSGAAPGRTATSRAASTPASAIYARPRSSSRVADATTTRSGPTPQSDTSHQHQRCSCPHSPRGRLRYAGHAGAMAMTCFPVVGPIFAGKFQFSGVGDSGRWTRKDHEEIEVYGGTDRLHPTAGRGRHSSR